MKFLIEKINTHPCIINPEDNRELADQLSVILTGYKRSIPLKRDNCGPINWDLFDYLNNRGFKCNIIHGKFKTDNLKLLDKNDLTKEQRKLFASQYSQYSNKNIVDFLKSNYQTSYVNSFYELPHIFLKYKNLILDDAKDMFLNGMDNKITKINYSEEKCEYLPAEKYLK